MRVPLKWLAEYVDLVVSVEELAHILTMSGTEVSGVERVDDTVLHLEVTPNRPDCLGVLGIAREVAALTDQPLRLPDVTYAEEGPDVTEQARIEIQASDLCRRYTASVIHDIRVGPSPPWLQARLTAAGVRPINNVVDITNYVMLEYGQPLHAFDYERLAGHRIEVRRARPGEALKTLDGTVRPLGSDLLVIADGARPVALAGIMGGAESEVTGQTRSVLLESANFDRVSIRRSSRLLRLRTESSARFDKGLPPAIAA
ncbi:MAG: phenylalanine--tRNA ligase beta subunit-related protein, partial [Candidatus Methylomirabilaceae bacterium]